MSRLKPLKLAVIGSRDWGDKKRVFQTLDQEIEHIHTIVSGHAVSGPDLFGERWANRKDIPTSIHHPATERKHAYHYRNRLIAEEADVGLAFQIGGSSGTQYTINYMRQLGKPCFIRRISQKPRDFDLYTALEEWCAQQNVSMDRFTHP